MAGNCVLSVIFETPMPGGRKMIEGTMSLSSNHSGGMELDLTNYFSNSGQVTVICGQENGATFAHDHGTAAEGKIYVRRSDAAGVVNTALTATGEDWSAINVPIIALGQAY